MAIPLLNSNSKQTFRFIYFQIMFFHFVRLLLKFLKNFSFLFYNFIFVIFLILQFNYIHPSRLENNQITLGLVLYLFVLLNNILFLSSWLFATTKEITYKYIGNAQHKDVIYETACDFLQNICILAPSHCKFQGRGADEGLCGKCFKLCGT